jgi:2-oxoglutarate dehydrogenase E1 component
MRGRQHAGRQLHDAGELLPRLRRQMHRDFRKPLIVFTPKSLLRHKKAVSRFPRWPKARRSTACCGMTRSLATATTTIKLKGDSEIRRVVMCSGKVYYDLLDEREKRGLDDVYILRSSNFIRGR